MSSTKEKLSRTQRELEALRAEYQEFAYVVSHDLSTPLRHIDAFSRLILEDNQELVTGKTKRYFDFVINSADLGKRLLESLLNFSRLNTRVKPFTRVDCNVILDAVLESLSELVEQSSAKIEVAKLPEISADEEQIFRVFYELLKNAIIFQNAGSLPRIEVKSESVKSGEQFSVSDNGIGIRGNQVDKIFRVLGRAVGDDYPGEGMGLAVAKKIVQRHNGEFRAESQEGNGSTFFFVIDTSD